MTRKTTKAKAKAKAAPAAKPEDIDMARARESAAASFANLREMVEALRKADKDDDEDAREAARETIQQDPLSVQVRDGWRNPGQKGEAMEFEILLSTGGPAVRIIGRLGMNDEAESPRLQFQDWFTPWHDWHDGSEDYDEILLAYCAEFYFAD